MILNPTRQYEYRFAIAIDPEVYELTTTGDPDAGWRFVLDDATRDRLQHLIREAVGAVKDARLAADPTVRPGYISVRVETGNEDVPPTDILDAIREIASVYNQRHATRRPDGTGFLDGLRFADTVYVEAVRPEGGMDADTFIDRRLGDDRVPDAERPVFTWVNEPSTADDPARRLEYEYVVPIDARMYDPITYSRSQGVELEFEWDDRTLEQFQTFLDKHSQGWDATVEVWPGYLRIRHDSTSLHHAPAGHLSAMMDAISRVNNHRGRKEVADMANVEVPRRPIRFTRHAYVGARRPASDSALDAWVRTHSLDDPDLEALATGLEAEVEELVEELEAADDDGGVDEPTEKAGAGGRTTAGRLRSIFGGG